MTSPSLLSQVTTGAGPEPPRMVIHGSAGVGKTTFACAAPKPIVLPFEDGLGALPHVARFPLLQSWLEAMNALKALYQEPHEFKTAVIDSLDWLEPLIWAHVATTNGKGHIEEFGYGKGYTYAAELWAQFFAGLRALQKDRGMTVICIAHSEIKRFDDPTGEPFDRYQIKLHKRAAELAEEWAEVIGFAHHEVHVTSTDVGFNKKINRGISTGRRLLGLHERPAYKAKTRYRLPPVIDLSWDAFVDAFAQGLTPAPAPAEPALAAPVATTTA